MNNKIKEIATAAFNKIPMDNKNPEKWIDDFILEYSRALIFECSDVVREAAKQYTDETKLVLKSTAVDVLDHFGL